LAIVLILDGAKLFLDRLSEWEALNGSQSSPSATQIRVLRHLANSTLEKVPDRGQDALYRTLFNYRLLDIMTWIHPDPATMQSSARKLRTKVPILTNVVSRVKTLTPHPPTVGTGSKSCIGQLAKTPQ
jgi:hypothetical protein